MKRIIALLALLPWLAAASAQTDTTLYHEPYRPQYHYTPRHRWIGDPCGLITHGGRHMAYSWGAATSDDLVRWTELNDHAIKGMPPRTAAFTGSVVVDSAGTAGYGAGAVVAVYTSFDEDTKIQSQSIAYSTDGGITFHDYEHNPVLDIRSTEFRDPTVIWHGPTGRWVMFVAMALDKKVAIYTSPDLKEWTCASDFGPLGDNERSWECPDIFCLPLDGDPARMRWVMVVSVNWAREQYFVGDFDGRTFTPDMSIPYPQYVDHGMDYYASRVFQTPGEASAPVYTLGWVNTWDYAGAAPSKWGKGIWSLPRLYSLCTTDGGVRLIQEPAPALAALHGPMAAVTGMFPAGITPLEEVSGMDNCYHLVVEIEEASTPCGLYLCQDADHALVISYNPLSGYLSIDRTATAAEDIPHFKRTAGCALGTAGRGLSLDIYVDHSTVEIFADGGRHVFTLLTYAGPGQTGASFWATSPVQAYLTAFKMQSIHP